MHTPVLLLAGDAPEVEEALRRLRPQQVESRGRPPTTPVPLRAEVGDLRGEARGAAVVHMVARAGRTVGRDNPGQRAVCGPAFGWAWSVIRGFLEDTGGEGLPASQTRVLAGKKVLAASPLGGSSGCSGPANGSGLKPA